MIDIKEKKVNLLTEEDFRERLKYNIDNNAEALEEVQALMTQLQEYVDNYFTNLDVQEEINNKLDQMATDGTFYNLINNLLFTDINNQIVQNAENIGTLNQELAASVTIPASTVAGPTGLIEIEVYCYYEGEDANCKSNNIVASLQQLDVTVSFSYTAAQ